MAYRVTSSAPGKVILFGEHAVVHGVTAVAASLSDLRIYVDVATTKDPSLCIYLHDFSEDGPQKDPFVVKYSDIRACLGGLVHGKAGAPKSPENPTDEYLDLLKNEFEAYPSHAAHGLMAISYMMVKLLPELVNVEAEDRSSSSSSSSSSREMPGLRIEVKSVGLPIGGGLGSSAAFSVALSAAFLRMRQALFQDVHAVGEEGEISAHPAWPISVFERDFVLTSTKGRSPQSEELLNTINAWAYAAEVVIHGAPSGLDNTTSCFGGALKYVLCYTIVLPTFFSLLLSMCLLACIL
jgi:mevalonate kinase